MGPKKTNRVGEIEGVVEPLLAPRVAVDTSAAGENAGVTLLAIKEVAGSGAAGGNVANPLLASKEAASTRAARKDVANEPNMSSHDLDPHKSEKTIGTTTIIHALIVYETLPFVRFFEFLLFFC